MKFIRRLLVLLFLLTALPAPAILAEGGVAVRPYWTFPTAAPVTHVQTGDVDGNGTPEVVMTTADNWVYVVENDGDLAWRYELETQATTLLVADIDGDGQTAEIWVGGWDRDFLLSATEKPIWRAIHQSYAGLELPALEGFAVDLDGDGQQELLSGNPLSVGVTDSKTSATRLIDFIRPVIDVWAGEVDGDGRPEIVPSVIGNLVYVMDSDLSPVWQQAIEGEVRLVQGGDVDGDGLAEIVVLSTSWELFLWENDGQQVWHNQNLTGLTDLSGLTPPMPGQLLVHDLNGDGQSEIIVLTPGAAGIQVFKGDGSQLWQQPLGLVTDQDAPGQSSEDFLMWKALESGFQSGLQAADINGDGQAEVVVATGDQGPVYLLAANGQRLVEYLAGKTTGTLAIPTER
ncbi:MAG: hypothetical protein HC875_40150, partial [Anaerolineales bacterium]|nr:hypothetical protein [Anaerolineales bacterium]